jgi:hypothetical protein
MDGNMAIGFMQTDGVRHRHIDFARGDSSGLADGIRILKAAGGARVGATASITGRTI